MFTTAIEDGHQPSLLKYAKKISSSGQRVYHYNEDDF